MWPACRLPRLGEGPSRREQVPDGHPVAVRIRGHAEVDALVHVGNSQAQRRRMLWRALDDESETVLAKRTLPVRSGDGVPTQLRLHAQAPEDPQFESVALVLAVGELRTDCERLDDELLERHGPSTGERIVVAYNSHDSL